jgi:hypothetical protein
MSEKNIAQETKLEILKLAHNDVMTKFQIQLGLLNEFVSSYTDSNKKEALEMVLGFVDTDFPAVEAIKQRAEEMAAFVAV